ncbi:13843_t:CDS:2 [Funneliformis mosseae]|uniref:13843_t:CDS:1 n=1 Tax=Funneliformis mosseae TaxID=27381 RepID=A0A9N9E4Y7_FUNMO|nr:13843_t:CDS:2 [Funneliformis mosseae]
MTFLTRCSTRRIVHWTEKYKRNKSPYCFNYDAEINISIFRSIRFYLFCRTNIVLSEDELLSFAWLIRLSQTFKVAIEHKHNNEGSSL